MFADCAEARRIDSDPAIFICKYLKDIVDDKKICDAIQLLIFDDEGMRENDYESIVKRIDNTFKDKQYLRRISGARQRWSDEDIEDFYIHRIIP